MTYDFETIVPKFDAILSRGLCVGKGERDGQMCIEAAICAALDLPHGDNPECVEQAVRNYKIALNDSPWSSRTGRATGLRELGIAQIGSKGVVDGVEFTKRLTEKTIRVLIPTLFREMFPADTCLLAAARCEREGTAAAADAAADAAAVAAAARYAAVVAAAAARHAAAAARHTAAAARHTAAADAAAAARYADAAAAARHAAAAARHTAAADAAAAARYADAAAATIPEDKYLKLSASLALEVLRELHSPGVLWLDAQVSAE